jgi:hypothetical protein
MDPAACNYLNHEFNLGKRKHIIIIIIIIITIIIIIITNVISK